MAYYQGQYARYNKQFLNTSSALADPTVVNVYVVRPDGLREKYVYGTHAVVVRSSAGIYYYDVSGSIPGAYVVRWEATGNSVTDGEERTFLFEASAAADAPDAPRSLGTTYFELQRAVGRFLGFNREPNLWQSNERLDADDIIRSGYRRFIWHPPITTSSLVGASGEIRKLKQEKPHTWSFVKPTKSLSLVAATHTYDLPEDFGEQIDGTLTFTTDQTPIALVADEQIRQLQSTASMTGVPKYASVGVLDGRATKYQVTFYPTPDVAYTVNFTYDIAPKDLSEQQPIPLGGPMHAETIIEACLSAAEKTLNDMEGLHEKKFLECLARSIVADSNLLATHADDPWPLEDKAKGLGGQQSLPQEAYRPRVGLRAESRDVESLGGQPGRSGPRNGTAKVLCPDGPAGRAAQLELEIPETHRHDHDQRRRLHLRSAQRLRQPGRSDHVHAGRRHTVPRPGNRARTPHSQMVGGLDGCRQAAVRRYAG